MALNNNRDIAVGVAKVVSHITQMNGKAKESLEDIRNTTPKQDLGNFKPLQLKKLSDVESKEVDWFWKPFIPFGTFTIISGEEGIGKTYITLSLANALASSCLLPLQSKNEINEKANVLLLSAEDSLAFTIKPRLESMKANCENIIAIDEPFTFNEEGILRLRYAIAETEAKLVIIDPLFSYTGNRDINRDNEIRLIGNQLIETAERFECAIIGIRHIGKAKGMGDARSAGIGGIGWRACCRSELLVGTNPENPKEKAICQIKNNLAEKSDKSIGFEIVDGEFFWKGEIGLTASQILSSVKSEEDKNASIDAIAFLREVLRDGEAKASDIQKEARQNGISDYSLRQAKMKLNVEVKKHGGANSGNQEWVWRINFEDVENA